MYQISIKTPNPVLIQTGKGGEGGGEGEVGEPVRR
jgi:hypothetical protein